MNGHGGYRPGAGRRTGGVAESRRLLLKGLERGFEIAGREKGLNGTREEVVVESIAQVAADLIRAGNGRDALAIMTQAAPRGGEDGAEESVLTKALKSLPGIDKGAPQSLLRHARTKPAPTQQENAEGATDPQSVPPPRGPFFDPQLPMLPARAARATDTRTAQDREGGGDPLPPGPPPPP